MSAIYCRKAAIMPVLPENAASTAKAPTPNASETSVSLATCAAQRWRVESSTARVLLCSLAATRLER